MKCLTASFSFSNVGYLQLLGGETAECVAQRRDDVFWLIGACQPGWCSALPAGWDAGSGDARLAEVFQRVQAISAACGRLSLSQWVVDLSATVATAKQEGGVLVRGTDPRAPLPRGDGPGSGTGQGRLRVFKTLDSVSPTDPTREKSSLPESDRNRAPSR